MLLMNNSLYINKAKLKNDKATKGNRQTHEDKIILPCLNQQKQKT